MAPPFWRKISLCAGEGKVDAKVADNVHEFVITVHHDGERVTDVTGDAPRFPWITCPGAIEQLKLLVGTPVRGAARIDVDQAHQCTHMLDLARLAVAQVQRGGTREYDISIRHADVRMLTLATLRRDGELLLDWQVKDGIVVSPPLFAGHDTQGRSRWPEEVLANPDLIEAALVLRRCVFVFRSRPFSRNAKSAADLDKMTGVCFSFQPTRSGGAFRPPGFQELP